MFEDWAQQLGGQPLHQTGKDRPIHMTSNSGEKNGAALNAVSLSSQY